MLELIMVVVYTYLLYYNWNTGVDNGGGLCTLFFMVCFGDVPHIRPDTSCWDTFLLGRLPWHRVSDVNVDGSGTEAAHSCSVCYRERHAYTDSSLTSKVCLRLMKTSPVETLRFWGTNLHFVVVFFPLFWCLGVFILFSLDTRLSFCFFVRSHFVFYFYCHMVFFRWC